MIYHLVHNIFQQNIMCKSTVHNDKIIYKFGNN